MATFGAAPDDGDLQALFEASPETEVHTSAAAEAAFVLGLLALIAAPFSVMHSLALGTAGVGVLLSVVGLAMTSRPGVAGGVLAPVGLAFALATLLLLGLRYLGLDTAFGDALLPTFTEWLALLDRWVPRP